VKAVRIAFEFACIMGALCGVIIASPFWLTKLVLQWHAQRRAA
jgi:hypothetical protein